MLVRRITAEETLAIRWPILRPGFPRESAIFEGDDKETTIHFGAFHADKLAGVGSIYIAPFPDQPARTNVYQLRGMATLSQVRGLGLGAALLRACEEGAREAGATILWCNARVSAASFYSRHGWMQSGAPFDIPTVGPHLRMFREL